MGGRTFSTAAPSVNPPYSVMDLTPAPLREGLRATPVATLKRFARTRRVGGPVRDYCELCREPIPSTHRHLLEVAAHQVLCACDPCALRFEMVVEGRYRLIPRDAGDLPDFHLDDAQWDDLALPIDLAFIVKSTPAKRVIALYPSPVGATESLLTLSAWEAIVADNPVLREMQPDVEALLINRVGSRRLYFLAPIDVCFQLVGIMRLHWRDLSGGEDVWREIDAFFARLAETAREAPVVAAAVPRGGAALIGSSRHDTSVPGARLVDECNLNLGVREPATSDSRQLPAEVQNA